MVRELLSLFIHVTKAVVVSAMAVGVLILIYWSLYLLLSMMGV